MVSKAAINNSLHFRITVIFTRHIDRPDVRLVWRQYATRLQTAPFRYYGNTGSLPAVGSREG
jgi:hypothetical protein